MALKDRLRELRPLYAPVDPASRTECRTGELAKCDLWFPPTPVPNGAGQTGTPPVLAMASGCSRVVTTRMIPSWQAGPDGHRTLLSGTGSSPRALVWDNESAVGAWRAGRPVVTEATNAFIAKRSRFSRR